MARMIRHQWSVTVKTGVCGWSQQWRVVVRSRSYKVWAVVIDKFSHHFYSFLLDTRLREVTVTQEIFFFGISNIARDRTQ